jgi:hypothetical protein
MRVTRTDSHRPGAIVPVDYTPLVQYERAHEVDGWPVPPFNIDRVIELQNSAPAASFGRIGKCGVCGAHFIAGALWRHDPTGDLVHLGHDCEDKYSMVADRSEWERWHKEQSELRATAVIRRERAAARDRFCAETPGIAEALAAREMKIEGADRDSLRRRGSVMILQDMHAKLGRFGSLSDKQVAFAVKLAAELAAPPPPAEVHVPAPEGRVTFTGKIVSAKWHDNDYGGGVKITVKVQTPDGTWLAWGSAPSGLEGTVDSLRGQEITIKATLKAGDEPHFSFFKRPILEGKNAEEVIA